MEDRKLERQLLEALLGSDTGGGGGLANMAQDR